MNGVSDLHFFLEMRPSRNRVCRLSAVWDRLVRRDASDKDGDRK